MKKRFLKRKAFNVFLSVLTAASLLGGCGSASGSGGTGKADSKDSIKIGLLFSTTGSTSISDAGDRRDQCSGWNRGTSN